MTSPKKGGFDTRRFQTFNTDYFLPADLHLAMKNHVYYVYILLCSDDSYYVGVTNDLTRRIEEHQNAIGDDSYTSSRLPVALVYQELFQYIDQAIRREKQLKGWNRDKKLALINRDIKKLKELASCKNGTSSSQWLRSRNSTS